MLRKVLHVDDEEDVRIIAELALSDIGDLEVCSCASGSEAVERVADFEPDLLLVDSMMPDMSGEDTVRRIRSLRGFEHTPVVFLTAVGHADAMQRFRALGPAAIILKPFDPTELLDELRETWMAVERAQPS